MSNMEISAIQEFYKGTNVFLTGGTGFLGKATIEKLLRNTEVETIYVLIREKKGQTPHMRIDSLFDDVLFDRLKKEKPKCRNKVEAIAGDCSIAGLGISITDRQRLISNINVILHVAATVNFNEHIKLAYNINVNGTKDLINLAREVQNLKSVVHVSTAYANCHLREIDEKLYEYPVKYSDVENALEKMTVEQSDLCTPKLLGQWPNSYTFTKALAESLVKDLGNGLAVGIFRPGIVVSTYKEPFPGWIDNLYGPTGLAAGAVSGLLRVSYCDGGKLADIVPVDTCVAALIVSAWDVYKRSQEKTFETIPVYNYVSSTENPITHEDFKVLNLTHGMDFVPSNAIWKPVALMTTNYYFYIFLKIFLHIIPAALLDLCTMLTGGKPKLLRIYKKVHKFSEFLSYFCLQEWKFSNNNVQNLWLKLNKTDQQLFPMSMQNVSWTLFFRRYIKGIRQYLLKESDATLEASRKRFKRFSIAHEVLKLVFYFFGSLLTASILSRVWNAICN
ncbi:fatty acyl-CoA reductase wat [Dendroctonus ponderosae]|uniref:Fatty acyl-CoA reductase n=1 Tax=Dendroctonus ponderosae TaxID=77166 RepID=U4UI33_DENPD|nr:fatty acyl-CoA reductase wat [Dendroctonus ponderosae]XP_019759307.2 fatty acyl-CoA reductase wat [Dendroctonus ponderosae]XP_048521868.1 fatty acyl-CoA reductase wat [Dendroctonus ponderosae]ERL90271.1 hypothetical protein D910_07623 [Dendroctonus ponderosae]KAH1018655.1 hypothetical protein HUJ05_006384 [Dendroctonus ponderosae]KAH1018656.1 hypothetical protein HUJ05_006384 [Dendroctonus ponderosae]